MLCQQSGFGSCRIIFRQAGDDIEQARTVEVIKVSRRNDFLFLRQTLHDIVRKAFECPARDCIHPADSPFLRLCVYRTVERRLCAILADKCRSRGW